MGNKKEEVEDAVDKAKAFIIQKDYKEARNSMKTALKLDPQLENGLEMLIVCETLFYGDINFTSCGIDWYSILHLYPSATFIKACVRCTKLLTYMHSMKCLKFPGAIEALSLLERAKSAVCYDRAEFDREREHSGLMDQVVLSRNVSFREEYLEWEPPLYPIPISDVGKSRIDIHKRSILDMSNCSTNCVADGGEDVWVPELKKFKNKIFDEMPQFPHYQPLEKYSGKVREGMMIGLDIAFVSLAEEIMNLDDPQKFWSKLEELLGQLTQLEEMGYNVEKLRDRLETLEGIAELDRVSREAVEKLEAEVKEHETRIVCHTSRVVELEAEIEESYLVIDKHIGEIGILKKDLRENRDEFAFTAKNMSQ